MWLDKLIEMKKGSGLTTKEIADGSGIPEPTLIKIFAGVTKDPKLTTIQQLVHYLGFSLDDLDDERHGWETNLLSSEEQQLIRDYRRLNQRGREFVLEAVRMSLIVNSGENGTTAHMEAAK